MVIRPLKGYRSFDEVLRSGRRVTSGPLLLTALSSSESPTELLLGVTVPKRKAPKAVVRNRIKRLLRRAIALAPEADVAELRGCKVVCVWRDAPPMPSMISLSDVQVRVGQALAKVKGHVR